MKKIRIFIIVLFFLVSVLTSISVSPQNLVYKVVSVTDGDTIVLTNKENESIVF